MKNYIFIFLLFAFSQCKEIKYSHTNREDNLYFVFTTFRHGARNHFFLLDSFGNLIYPIGELTNYGKIQNLEIGKKYRERYSNFLNMNYDKNEIYMRVSDVDRVVISAQKQLEGLFNKKIDDKNFEKVSIGLSYWNLYHLDKKEKEEMDRYEKYCNKKRRLEIDYKKLFKSEIAPILKSCYGTRFTLSIHAFCDSTFSAYFEYKYGKDKENKIGKCGEDNAKKFYDFCVDWYNSFKDWNEYGAYMFFMLFRHIFIDMNNSINGNGPLKMMMIGGHETTIDKFMDFLDGLYIIPRTEYPHFAFNIVIELRKYLKGFYIEIYYNDILKYNNTFLSFQNILNNSQYSNLYNYCGIPPWEKKKDKKEPINNDNKILKNETQKKEVKENEQNEINLNKTNIKNIEQININQNNTNEENKKSEINMTISQPNDFNSIMNKTIFSNNEINSNSSNLIKNSKKVDQNKNYLILPIISAFIIIIIITILAFVYYIYISSKGKKEMNNLKEEVSSQKDINSSQDQFKIDQK